MRLFAIRHLPTEANVKGFLQGKVDYALLKPTAFKQEKILRNIEVLGDIRFDAVLTSQLLRTQQTAYYHGYQDYRIEPLANGLNFGQYEGTLKTEFVRKFNREWYHSVDMLPLGESFEGFRERIFSFFAFYADCENVLLFGHRAWLRAARALIIKSDIDEMNHWSLPHGDMVVLKW